MKKTIFILYSCYVLIVFCILMFVAFPFIVGCLLFGKIKGGNYIYKVCQLWAKTWYLLIGIQHKEIIEEAIEEDKQYVFIANHISYLDITDTLLSINQPYRVLGKAEMVKYPIFGFIYKAAVILVDRSNPQARVRSLRAMRAALNQGLSVFIFPEGKFNEGDKLLKSFYDGAFKLAHDTNVPIKPFLFLDANQRLHQSSIFRFSPGASRVVSLPAIEMQAGETVGHLKERVFAILYAALEKYQAKLPKEWI